MKKIETRPSAKEKTPSRAKPVGSKPATKRWELIGHVGVDSGQLMVCDPCYIDSQWIKNQEPAGHPPMVLSQKGKIRYPSVTSWRGQWPFPWGSYSDVCPELGMSVNDAREAGFLQEVDLDPSRDFSYRGACDATLGSKGHGEMIFKAGHTGAGVAFSSGYGDGVYPVYGRRNSEGRIIEVRIKMG